MPDLALRFLPIMLPVHNLLLPSSASPPSFSMSACFLALATLTFFWVGKSSSLALRFFVGAAAAAAAAVSSSPSASESSEPDSPSARAWKN